MGDYIHLIRTGITDMRSVFSDVRAVSFYPLGLIVYFFPGSIPAVRLIQVLLQLFNLIPYAIRL